jgi:FdrA protein
MRLTRDMEAVPGVTRAAAMMGTPPNRALLAGAALLTADGESAGPTDLVIAVVADTGQAADAAKQAVESALTARPATADTRARPRTLGGALRALPDATLALVSRRGPHCGAGSTSCSSATTCRWPPRSRSSERRSSAAAS